ncbi:MAG: protein kinase [Verrucomicrobia bacterium]|nr:protein kinase [Verrucomicrobiota bacterium]
MSNEVERVFIGNGRYALDRQLGAGGAGIVYLAFDTILGRWVAVKKTSAGDDTVSREAKAMASFHHTNIVMLHDIIEEGDSIFFVMEFVQGQTLEELAQPMTEEAFREFATQCLLGLGFAHEKNIVHRDIKPGNIMLEPQLDSGYRVKLLDFGQSRAMAEPSLQTMDHSGSVVGSIYMMSPEQLSHDPLDLRTDFYSLGCVFYQALTLERPFTGATVPEVVAAHLKHRFQPLKTLRPDLPVALTLWVEKMFAFAREDRPPDAFTALKDLKATMSHTKAQALSSESKGIKVMSGAVLKASPVPDIPKPPISVVANPGAIRSSPIRIASQPTVSAVPSVSAVRMVAAAPVVYPISVTSQTPQEVAPLNPVRVVAAEPILLAKPVSVLPTPKIAEVRPVVVPKVSLPPL